MQKGNEGAEELSQKVNSIFGPLVHMVYDRGGMIPYYAGDSFTAIFPVIDDLDTEMAAVAQTAIEAQKALPAILEVEAQTEEFQLGVKAGISIGQVEWGIVGQEEGGEETWRQSRTFYFRGSAIDQCAKCQVLADKGEIVVDKSVQEILVRLGGEMDIVKRGFFFLKSFPDFTVRRATQEKTPKLIEEIAQKYLPPEVIQYNSVGEFRPVTSVFISFSGASDHRRLNTFSTIVLEQAHIYGGYLKEVDFGDKGGLMLIFFGAPVSFENNVERALQFAVGVNQQLKNTKKSTEVKTRIGITSGTAYTGLIGGEERCQYAAMGDKVNIAARLMMNAEWGEILVDKEVQKVRHFKFQLKGNIRYKGMIEDIPTYRLAGYQTEEESEYKGKIVGRDAELKTILEFANPIFEGRFAGIVSLFGEAGVGKSRLAYEVKQQLNAIRKINWHTCQADEILRKPFNPFIYFLRTFFGVQPDNSAEANRRNFEERFQELFNQTRYFHSERAETIRGELLRTKSILLARLEFTSENSLWDQLDAKGRYENTFAALANLFVAESITKPLVIEIEDAHWIDESSKAFLREFIKVARNYPILFLITSRYLDDGSKGYVFAESKVGDTEIRGITIDLNVLSDEGLRQMAEARLGNAIDDELLQLLKRTSNGNPFYIEQILDYFSESGILSLIDGQWHIEDSEIKLSNSINAILTARIDRLSGIVKETVKAAAVIGREFEIPVLSEVIKHHEEYLQRNGDVQMVLREQVKTAEQGQIWRAMNELRYIFRHSLLREAAYDMQLSTRLRRLHRLIAEAIKKLYEHKIENHYIDLAYHYKQAEMPTKAIEYYQKAADRARQNYQNNKAIELYNILLDFLKEKGELTDIVKTKIKLGGVLLLTGEWAQCALVLRDAVDGAEDTGDTNLIARATNKLGYFLTLRGDYDRALEYLKKAVSRFEILKDELGIVKVYGHLGDLYFRQGKYEDAKAYFIQSLQLNEELDTRISMAQTASNLGLTYMNQGLYDDGVKYMENQLAIVVAAKDRQGLAVLYTNLGIVLFEKGDYEKAQAYYQKGLTLSEELGNKLLAAIAIGSLGRIYQRKGKFDKAHECFEKDLQICEDLDDKQGKAIAHELMGELYSVTGAFDKAKSHLNKTLEMSEALGYQKGIAKAANTLGDIACYQKAYNTSIQYYEKAIRVSRSIANKLILGYSLVEIVNPLLAINNIERAEACSLEAQGIAQELQNPDLLFESELATAKIHHAKGNISVARELLHSVVLKYTAEEEQATAYYELWLLDKTHENFRQQMLNINKRLFQRIPAFITRRRIEEAEK